MAHTTLKQSIKVPKTSYFLEKDKKKSLLVCKSDRHTSLNPVGFLLFHLRSRRMPFNKIDFVIPITNMCSLWL